MNKYLSLTILLLFFVLGATAQDSHKYVMKIQKKDTLLSIPVSQIDSIYFVEQTTQDSLTFDINVSNITSDDANIVITPSNDDIPYYYSISDSIGKDNRDKNYNGSWYDMEVGWWSYLAQFYSITWQEVMQNFLVTGQHTANIEEDYGSTLMWNTPYYVYSFGIDNDGNLTSAIAEKEFRTAKPTPSDNNITVAVKQELSDSVLIDVTTTNNDTYFIDCQKKSYVDYYLNQYNGSKEQMFYQFYRSILSQINDQYFHNGNQTDLKANAHTSDADYYIIICGFDGGPTTNIQLIPFHTAAQ